MIVERIWTGNAYRNYNYLIACPETGEALAIDPLDHEKCLAAAKAQGLADHADPQHARAPRPHRRQRGGGRGHRRQGDRAPPRRRAHRRRGPRRQGRRRDQGRQDASSSSAWTRRATRCATSACARTPTQPALFSGDTLFNAGAGNCHNGGNPEELYATFVDQLAKLPDDTRVYPGHDYIENNLRFTLAREPDNAAAKALLPEVSGPGPGDGARHDAAARRSRSTPSCA